LAAKYKMQ